MARQASARSASRRLAPLVLLLFSALAFSAPPAKGAGDEQGAPGQRVFQRVCAPCHGEGPGLDGSPQLPGTAALQRKYEGKLPAVLQQRRDLDAVALKYFVRHGTGAMPMFRPAEITDAEIAAIAAWLAARNR